MFDFAFLSLIAATLSLFSSIFAAEVIDITTVPTGSAAQAPLTFGSSDWIWTATTTASEVIALRKDFTAPFGKSLIAAEIIITAIADMNLYVNGDYIGSLETPQRWGYAQRFCVDLLPGYNVFAVNASTPDTTLQGLVATILLTYSDGTTDTLFTESSWRATNGSPAGFEQLSFDDTTWDVATVVSSYKAALATRPVVIPADPPVVTLSSAQWVWANDIPANGVVPAESRAFRRTFTPAPGQIPMSANIIISTDDAYTLYVNGVPIGNGTTWPVAQQYILNFGNAPSEIVLAVLATNTSPSPAGVLVVTEVNMQPSGRANCTAGSIFSSDGAWKSTLDEIPTGFKQPGYDDSTWPAVTQEGAYGIQPWDTITIAAASAPITI
ncbi:hypothetical protein B0H11DRAFT_2059237 [Mycena galericulata]|nr:hypothetical protein B0H11DRAFT_2059237 [Mycena galericulata]